MRITVIILGILMSITHLNAQDNRGKQIAEAAEAADRGYGHTIVNSKMVLTNKNGQTSERLLTTKTLEVLEDGDKNLIVFQSPRDVKGTATLSFTHREGADEQWLYLPAIKRVKRISSNNKSGPFVGSEFAYEDLSSFEISKYDYKFLEENGDLLLVEQYPKDPQSGYTRRIVTYNKAKGYRIEKIDFYDRKDTLLKTLTHKNYQQFAGKFWRALEFEMINHQTGKATSLYFEDYDFTTELSSDDFTQIALKRAGS